MATASSYYCYRYSRFMRVWPQDAIVCPDCDGGFLEELERRAPVSSWRLWGFPRKPA
ncbi:hypothetical protein MA16_Dca015456 [Dendrobium catenatum]|uniref:RING-type E3 ubiquitin transferase n=1 Tax=Dendrobium catenatum TaxID=906689 RepID=A0A2I0X9I7_9ASPA|nr:hypothetical protein MA16_Dca015456 [Dendrobium catenatum]